MSFLDKLKYALGLDTTRDLEDDVDFNALPDATVSEPRKADLHTGHTQAAQQSAVKSQGNAPEPTPAAPADDNIAFEAIFEHVVSTFNIALPDFLRKSVDPEAQRKYLYNTLSSDLQHFIKGLAANAESKYREFWNAERDKITAKLREAEKQVADVTEKNKELRQNLLSADRQKRALSTRSAELEKQIVELEADREQRDLESKSMANKVKAVSVYEQELNELRAEVSALNTQLADARRLAAKPLANEQVAQVQRPEDAKLIAELQAAIDEARKQNEALQAQITALKDNASKPVAAEPPAEIKVEITRNAEPEAEPAQPEKQHTKPEPVPETKPEPRQRRHRQRQTPEPLMDDVLGDTEWIVTPSSKRGRKDGDRARHDANADDDRQMSLF